MELKHKIIKNVYANQTEELYLFSDKHPLPIEKIRQKKHSCFFILHLLQYFLSIVPKYSKNFHIKLFTSTSSLDTISIDVQQCISTCNIICTVNITSG